MSGGIRARAQAGSAGGALGAAIVGALLASAAPAGIPPEVPVPSAVRLLVGGERPEAAGAIYAFLREAAPPAWAGPGYDALKDRVLMRLAAMPDPFPGMATELAAVVGDREADPIGRVYAAQYLVPVYERFAAAPGWRDSPEAAAVRATLYEAAADPDPRLQGTALLHLADAVESRAGFDRARIAGLALERLADEDAPALVRSAALHVGAALGLADALPAARAQAARMQPVHVRLAAIHALGILGDADDTAPLRQWLDHPRHREVHAAVAAALRRIEARLAILETKEQEI